MRYGRLETLGESFIEKYRRKVWCKCDCGNVKKIRLDALQAGMTISCGCAHREAITTHGRTKTREYKIWRAMLNRCKDPRNIGFDDYGGRGIKVCDRWLDFGNFFADMGLSNGLQLERLDNDKDYEPGNCIWTTRKRNCRNKRNNYVICYKGITACLAEHCERLGLDYYKTHGRLYAGGWSVERAFEEN